MLSDVVSSNLICVITQIITRFACFSTIMRDHADDHLSAREEDDLRDRADGSHLASSTTWLF